jgi:Mycobacterium membrane protein
MTSQRSAMPRLLAAPTAFITAIGICPAAHATPQLPHVTYQLSGTSPVADYISYQTDDGQSQQVQVPLPWKTQFTAATNQVYVISAQGPGSIACTILLDGQVVSQATANGAPARTACAH